MLDRAYDYGRMRAVNEAAKLAAFFEDETTLEEKILGTLGASTLGKLVGVPLMNSLSDKSTKQFRGGDPSEYVTVPGVDLTRVDINKGFYSPQTEDISGPTFDVSSPQTSTPAEIDDIRSLMGAGRGLQIGVHDESISKNQAQEGFYIESPDTQHRGIKSSPEGRVIVRHIPERSYGLPSGPASGATVNRSVLLHELGHATGKNPGSSKLRRLLSDSYFLSSRYNIPSLTALATNPFFVDPNDKRQIAGAVGANLLAHAPTLLEEYVASNKAFKALDALKASKQITEAANLAGKATLRGAYKTYLASAGINAAIPGITLALMNDDIRESINPFD